MTLARRLLIAGSGASGFPSPVATRIALYNGTGDNGSTYGIGAADFDGMTWTEYASNPVLTKGTGWESNGVKDPRLVWDGSQFVAFYAGYNATPTFKLGRATAPSHHGPWTKDASNPVLSVGSSGAFDESSVAAPVVYFGAPVGGHQWWMWYAGTSGGTSAVGVAHSDDGITWTKDGAISGLAGYGPGAVYFDGSTIYLYTNHNFRVYLFTASSPTGTYTLSAGSPLILPRSTAGNVSSVLSANASAGASSVSVVAGALANLQVGEPVIIVDINSGPEVLRVASVGSTSIGFTTNLVSSYQTADGATIRSLGYTFMDCRSVIPAAAGGFEMFGTPFRALDGLTFSGPNVWEGSLRHTSAALDGPWATDWATGLIFPLVNDASWSGTSAENPSVLITP